MAPRPAKRQRRSTIILSDDDIDNISNQKSPLRSSTRTDAQLELTRENGGLTLSPRKAKKTPTRVTRPSISASPKSSLDKPRKALAKSQQANGASLRSFFSKASEEERWERKEKTPDIPSDHDTLKDDIEDDDSFDEAFTKLENEARIANNEMKKTKTTLLRTDHTIGKPPTSSQRFAKPVVPAKRSSTESLGVPPPSIAADERPWADRYGPTNLDELAVHKKKVSDVQNWLENCFSGRDRQKILVLKGPAGSGKTATLSLICRSRGYDLVQWQNPVISDANVGTSISAQFNDFVNRGSHFSSLSFGLPKSISNSAVSRPNPTVLLAEEIPVLATRHSSVLESFRSTLIQHLSKAASSQKPFARRPLAAEHPPLVIIISETLVTSSTALSDSFTLHRLLGAELIHHPLLTVIEFNPVAPTFIAKALETTIKKEARESGRRRIPGPAVLQKLADVGDIRSAINSLEFLCCREQDKSDWSGTVAAKPKMSAKEAVPLTEMEKNSLLLISQRESTLDMFHATGKVLYNKREDPRILDTRASPPPRPPDHLMHKYTPKLPQCDVSVLLNETGTDIQTFVSTLHENYVLSCNGDNFVEHLERCSEVLSDSDILDPENKGRRFGSRMAAYGQSYNQTATTDALRQDEISFQVASRGLLFSLPHPVHRAAVTNARKADAFKMFYPASLRLWRPMEEMEGLVTLLAQPDIRNLQLGPRTTTDGVASWKFKTSASFGQVETGSGAERASEIIPRTTLSRHDLVLTVLPYTTKIKAGQNEDVKLLNKVTQFRGSHVMGDEPFDELEPEVGPPPTVASLIDRLGDASGMALNAGRGGSKIGASSGSSKSKATPAEPLAHDADADAGMGKLYISDDDIVDD